ncbi:H-2 class I histocompatibility antigen, alpha chain-like isoform X2 [Pleurodeles waltl]|uniref:H-2 class I histocompatibility antigen, alpha chain-like isoform X2 n=1 Tax=Pleurodeles waltl TaxID=8319 RepID=UPI00370979C3
MKRLRIVQKETPDEEMSEFLLWKKLVTIYSLTLITQITISMVLVSVLCHYRYFDESIYTRRDACACPDNTTLAAGKTRLKQAWCYLSEEENWPDCSAFDLLKNLTFDDLITHLNKTDCLIPDPAVTNVTSIKNEDGTVTVVCFASGFFPDRINMTWERDGLNITDEAEDSGIVRNEDSTYRVNKSITIDSEDQNTYTCTITHEGSGLNRVITYIPESDTFIFLKLSVGLSTAAGCIIFLVFIIFCCKV